MRIKRCYLPPMLLAARTAASIAIAPAALAWTTRDVSQRP